MLHNLSRLETYGKMVQFTYRAEQAFKSNLKVNRHVISLIRFANVQVECLSKI